ncbi:MAG: hypothetical protein IIZ22_05550 [Clostridia bacterium]|nr:hypothetical protein [Clostridia bacterium]
MKRSSLLKALVTVLMVLTVISASFVPAYAAKGVYTVADGTETVRVGEIPNEPGKDTNDSIIVVNLPSSVRNIENGAFKNCPNIRIMNVDGKRNSVNFDPKYVFYTIHGLKVNYDTPPMDSVPAEYTTQSADTTTTTKAPETTTAAPETTTDSSTTTTTEADTTTTTTTEAYSTVDSWDELISGDVAEDTSVERPSVLAKVLPFVGAGAALIGAIVLMVLKFKK